MPAFAGMTVSLHSRRLEKSLFPRKRESSNPASERTVTLLCLEFFMPRSGATFDGNIPP